VRCFDEFFCMAATLDGKEVLSGGCEL
jgi:hypothetical protein